MFSEADGLVKVAIAMAFLLMFFGVGTVRAFLVVSRAIVKKTPPPHMQSPRRTLH